LRHTREHRGHRFLKADADAAATAAPTTTEPDTTMSFLAIDIGNTRLKWAQYDAARPGARLLAHGAVFIETIDTLAALREAGVTIAETPSDLGSTMARVIGGRIKA